MKNKEGVITIKVLLMVSTVLISFVALLHVLDIKYNRNMLLRSQKTILESNLAEYDTYLYSNYGLYGMTKIKEGYFHTGQVFNHKVFLKGALSNPDILEARIVDFMIIRLPGNYIDQFLARLDIIKHAHETKKAISLKEPVDAILKDLEQLYQERDALAIRINQFDPNQATEEINEINRKWKSEKSDYIKMKQDRDLYLSVYESDYDAYQTYQQVYILLDIPSRDETMKLQELQLNLHASKKAYEFSDDALSKKEEVLESIIEEANQFQENLLMLYEDNKKMKVFITAVKAKSKEAIEVIGDTEELLESVEGIEAIILGIEDELAWTKKKLQEGQVLSDVDVEPIEIQIDENLSILEDLCKALKIADYSSDVLMTCSGLESIDTYHKITIYSKEVDLQAQAYVEEYDEELPFSVEVEEGVIPDIELIEDQDHVEFWSITNLKTHVLEVRNAVAVNEYIISTFTTFADPSFTDYDFFDKYNKDQAFLRGEVEYILFGSRLESVNVSATIASIYGVRGVMNTFHVYLDSDKYYYSECIGWQVAGWTGFGAPIVSNGLRIGWGLVESVVDMAKLLKGDEVPFIKLTPEDWYTDLGVVSDKVKDTKLYSISFTYHDYLRFLLLSLKRETRLNRIINLINLNLHTHGSLTLDNYYNAVQVHSIWNKKAYKMEDAYE